MVFSNFCLILELRNEQGCHRPEAVRNLQPPQSMPWGGGGGGGGSTLLLSSVSMICVIACRDIYLLGLFSLGGGGGGGWKPVIFEEMTFLVSMVYLHFNNLVCNTICSGTLCQDTMLQSNDTVLPCSYAVKSSHIYLHC